MYKSLNDVAVEVARIAEELDSHRSIESIASEIEIIANELDFDPTTKVALSPLQKEYREYFLNKLEEHGVNSPASLPDEDAMRAFFNDIKSGWVKGEGEK